MSAKTQKQINKYSIGDVVHCYYKGNECSRFPNGEGIAVFTISKIKIETIITDKATRHEVKYTGHYLGGVSYEWYDENFIALTKRDLAIKLIEQDILPKCFKETEEVSKNMP